MIIDIFNNCKILSLSRKKVGGSLEIIFQRACRNHLDIKIQNVYVTLNYTRVSQTFYNEKSKRYIGNSCRFFSTFWQGTVKNFHITVILKRNGIYILHVTPGIQRTTCIHKGFVFMHHTPSSIYFISQNSLSLKNL